MRAFLLLLALGGPVALASAGESRFPLRPDDPQAVYVTPDRFPVTADGVADDTAALQAAIDRVQETTRRGIVRDTAGRRSGR